MKLKKRINIELLSKSLTKHIPVIQNDRGRIIECYITDCQIPTGTKVKFWAMKPSKKLIYNDCTLKDNVVSIELTNQTLAEKGSVACQLEFDGDVSSYEFFLDVERDISGNGVVSENESTVLDALLEEMRVAIANVKSETDKAKAATAEAKKATEEAIKATQESRNPIKEVTSSDITADQTHQGAAIIKEIQGGMKQGKTNGYQLFDASKLPTKSQGGVTVTNNGDGSFTVSGSGNITENMNYYYEFTREEALKLLKVGTLTLNAGNLSYPLVGVLIHSNSHFTELNSVNSENVSVEITQDMLDANDLSFRLRFYAALGHAIIPGTIKPMLYQEGDGTWEPFTGGVPSPNPDYPQEIKGVCSKYFSGNLSVGGYYAADGTYRNNFTQYVCDKEQTFIPCKKGDVITVNSETNVLTYCFWRYDKDKNFKKAHTTISNTYTVEDGIEYVRIDLKILDSGTVNLNTIGEVEVLKNEKECDFVVNTNGKNLLDDNIYYSSYKVGDVIECDAKYIVPIKIPLPKQFIGKKLTFSAIAKNFENLTNIRCSALVNGSIKYGNIINKINEYMLTKVTFTMETENDCIYFNYGSGGKVSVKNIQLNFGEYTPYSPYKESVSYIPLDSPLYEGDRIYLEDGELWEYRENARVVFDGSEDEGWIIYDNQSEGVSFYAGIANSRIGFGTSMCDKFRNIKQAWNPNYRGIYGIYSDHNSTYNRHFRPPNAEVQTTEQWKTWLQSNPVEVVYKLATPTLKKLGSAEAFNLRTFDERTYIEVVGSKELGTENTFIVPRNQSGGLITDAFATSKRNEINAAGQANLASRISALEQLAVKESV